MDIEKKITNSANETFEVGKTFANKLQQGDVVAFYGDLGAGKTEFIKGICSAFGVRELVNSPTFTIINQYVGTKNSEPLSILHIDLYRINQPKELDEIGFSECLETKSSLVLIEWAENAANKLYNLNYKVKFLLDDEKENHREIIISFIE